MVKQNVVFFHIPKTGGTTLNYILSDIYKCKFLWLRNDIINQESRYFTPIDLFFRIPEKKRGKFKAITGHQIQQVLDYIPQSFKSVVLARNPIHQVPSYYFHHLRHQNDSPSNKLIRSYQSLQEFLESSSFYYPNPQSRSLLYDNLKLLDSPQKAKKAIHDFVWNRVSLCGTTDRFESFLSLLSFHLNWKSFSFAEMNASQKSKYDLNKVQIKLIKERNEIDQYLYEQVAEKLKVLMHNAPESFNFSKRQNVRLVSRALIKFQQYKFARLVNMPLKDEVGRFWLKKIK